MTEKWPKKTSFGNLDQVVTRSVCCGRWTTWTKKSHSFALSWEKWKTNILYSCVE